MKRPVLGIIVVLCLQLGFVAYTAIDRPSEVLVAVNEVTSGANPTANPPNISNSPEFLNADADQDPNGVDREEIVVSTTGRRTSKRPVGATFVPNKKIVKIPAARAVNRVPQFVALRKPSETRLKTEYPQAMPLDRESKDYQLSARAVPRSKKKSFFSKSVSVLKKPYDWLKALGSRIN